METTHNEMPHRLIELAANIWDLVYWGIVIFIGSLATKINYGEDIHQLLTTAVSMSVGAVCTWYIKRWLDNKLPPNKFAMWVKNKLKVKK